MGGNPQASGGSLLACPDVLGELDAHPARAAARSSSSTRAAPGTADHADEWVPILPGTDAAFLLAMCNVLFAEGLIDARRASTSMVEGRRRRCATSCADFTPESVAAFVPRPGRHDPPARPRVRGRAERGALYGRIGLCNQEFGTLASWLVDVVNILTGNFDRPGGLMWGNPVAWPMAWMASTAKDGPRELRPVDSRGCAGVPEVLGQVPAVVPGRGDRRRPGDGPDQGAVHRRRQPGDQRARLGAGSRRRCPSSSA